MYKFDFLQYLHEFLSLPWNCGAVAGNATTTTMSNATNKRILDILPMLIVLPRVFSAKWRRENWPDSLYIRGTRLCSGISRQHAFTRRYETQFRPRRIDRISLARTEWAFSLSLWNRWCVVGTVSLGRLPTHSVERHFVTSPSGWSNNLWHCL